VTVSFEKCIENGRIEKTYHNEFITSQLFSPFMVQTCNNATFNNMKLVHWPLMGELLHLVQRRGNNDKLRMKTLRKQ